MRDFREEERSSSFLAVFDSSEACSAREVGALGNNAKYVDQTRARERRKSLYFQQRKAANLLPEERVKHCRWTVQRRDNPVELHVHDAGFASYSGLQTCGSVWLCPVCSRSISETRRTELNKLLAWSRAEKYFPIMLTLTARHDRNDDLREQLAAMKAAKKRLRQRREWRALKPVFVGSVTATEVTHGEAAGWHTHFHEIIIVRADTERRAVEMFQQLGPVWLACLSSQGLDGIEQRAWQVQGASAAGNYIGKWGAAEEVALSGQKKGRKAGRTAAQLLHDAAIYDDERAARLWSEFARVFKGSRQLVWSDRLKVLAGIDEVDDAEAAEEAEAHLVALIDPETWRGREGFLGARYRRVKILEAAEKGGGRRSSIRDPLSSAR